MQLRFCLRIFYSMLTVPTSGPTRTLTPTTYMMAAPGHPPSFCWWDPMQQLAPTLASSPMQLDVTHPLTATSTATNQIPSMMHVTVPRALRLIHTCRTWAHSPVTIAAPRTIRTPFTILPTIPGITQHGLTEYKRSTAPVVPSLH